MKNNFCILIDDSNDWIRPFAIKYLKSINLDPKLKILNNPNQIKEFETCFVLGYTKILSKEELQKSCKYFVVHESSLPDGRGFAPLFWQVIEGKNIIETCLIELDFPVDSGRIVLKETIKLNGTELYNELRSNQAKATFSLIDKYLKSSSISYEIQTGNGSTYRKRNKLDSKLDINKSIASQFNLLRTCNNEEWPAYFEINNKKYCLKIFEK